MSDTSPRLPPGQVETRKWPVLHYGAVPRIDRSQWILRVWGEVENPLEIGWRELQHFPQASTHCDIHCVTQWSRFDNTFGGVRVSDLLRRAVPLAAAKYVLVHAAPDYTTNLPLEDLDRPANLIALSWNGEPLTPEHGGPARLLVPHLYLWKSAKWVTGLQLLQEDYPGFWEQNGYHMLGDPWKEQRYGRPDPVRMRRGPR
ncbi:MAG: sulfite oxidase-like oxidoreductase [Gemmatimonadetes bacterium]|nr:sulfite oxidase-like oxidoreductase [Gemmatimonadota bacterium]